MTTELREIDRSPRSGPDAAVVAAVQAGDRSAFASLVERHRREIQAYCSRMLGSVSEAEDLAQETFLRAWRSRASFEGRSTFRAWIYRIATNVCLDRLRCRRLVAGPDDAMTTAARPSATAWNGLPDEVASNEQEPDAAVAAKETVEVMLLAAIRQLSPRQRAVLILRDVLDWSAADAAALLDLSVAAVNSALQRARATVQAHLSVQHHEPVRGSQQTPEERELLQWCISVHERPATAPAAELRQRLAL